VPATSVVSTARSRGLRSTTLKGILRAALRALGLPRASVSLVLIDDEGIRALNRDFLEHDHATDVLSFPLADPRELSDPSRPVFLGEIYISVETARAQARAARRPFPLEVAHLLIHGILHLLGHDHATPAQRRRMRSIESRLLRDLQPMIRMRGSTALEP